jgi:hypothetical protein
MTFLFVFTQATKNFGFTKFGERTECDVSAKFLFGIFYIFKMFVSVAGVYAPMYQIKFPFIFLYLNLVKLRGVYAPMYQIKFPFIFLYLNLVKLREGRLLTKFTYLVLWNRGSSIRFQIVKTEVVTGPIQRKN